MPAVRYTFPSFTKQDRNDKQFLVPIALRLVMEPEALPRLFGELTEVGFYNIVSVEYERAKVDPMQQDYVYGPKPVFEVLINLEGYYLHTVFDKWMPAAIKTELITALPPGLDSGDTGGGGGGMGPGRLRGRG